ncbi:MAG: hypothetical protein IPK28_11340 [Devosia sp.]|nr:hypothetical protein [Devosia sp.]
MERLVGDPAGAAGSDPKTSIRQRGDAGSCYCSARSIGAIGQTSHEYLRASPMADNGRRWEGHRRAGLRRGE